MRLGSHFIKILLLHIIYYVCTVFEKMDSDNNENEDYGNQEFDGNAVEEEIEMQE